MVLLVACCALLFLPTIRARGPAHDACREAGASLEYFPESNSRAQHESGHRYASYLSGFGEPSLSCATRAPVYRFLWVRSFHGPLIVRVDRRGDTWHLVAVERVSSDGKRFDTRRVARMLTRDEGRRLELALARANLFETPSRARLDGLDGAEWVVEARDADRYRLHEEWSPREGPVREIGEALLSLTGWRFGPRDIY
ncbi:hypothetical protein [Lysobacter hankyongensis]|uniref:hypothetical protein n=1 Tax=Lysobacter hankyongensis TaxID=1176535 RepID=UPI0031E81CD2